MADFNDFISSLKEGIADFAVKNWKDQLEAVMTDGNAFLEKAKEDLKRWTQELAERKITADDFEWLAKGKKDLAEMLALKQVGLTAARIDRCRAGIIDIVIKTALKIFL